MATLQRQLNLYGFRCLDRIDQKGVYFHPQFIRGKYDQVRKIRRKKTWPTKASANALLNPEPAVAVHHAEAPLDSSPQTAAPLMETPPAIRRSSRGAAIPVPPSPPTAGKVNGGATARIRTRALKSQEFVGGSSAEDCIMFAATDQLPSPAPMATDDVSTVDLEHDSRSNEEQINWKTVFSDEIEFLQHQLDDDNQPDSVDDEFLDDYSLGIFDNDLVNQLRADPPGFLGLEHLSTIATTLSPGGDISSVNENDSLNAQLSLLRFFDYEFDDELNQIC